MHAAVRDLDAAEAVFGMEERLHLLRRDIRDPGPLRALVGDVRPEELYNLAGESSVSASFDDPQATWESNAHVVVHLLDAIRLDSPATRFYQASSGEMFGSVPGESVVHDETAALNPQSPYAAAKAAAHMLCRSYRESYGIRIACGILFNHESRRRGERFLSRKVVDHVQDLRDGIADRPLALGNLKAQRDWGFAPDYVEGMLSILRQAESARDPRPGRVLPRLRARHRRAAFGLGARRPRLRARGASSSTGSSRATTRSPGRPASRRRGRRPWWSTRPSSGPPTRRRSPPIRAASKPTSAGSPSRGSIASSRTCWRRRRSSSCARSEPDRTCLEPTDDASPPRGRFRLYLTPPSALGEPRDLQGLSCCLRVEKACAAADESGLDNTARRPPRPEAEITASARHLSDRTAGRLSRR